MKAPLKTSPRAALLSSIDTETLPGTFLSEFVNFTVYELKCSDVYSVSSTVTSPVTRTPSRRAAEDIFAVMVT